MQFPSTQSLQAIAIAATTKVAAAIAVAFAAAIAAEEGIGALTDGHMKVIRYLREQQTKGAALTIRSMGKSGVVTTKELYDLFPGGPLKKSSKIAGIPKPVGCI